jgi:hypothetical protein
MKCLPLDSSPAPCRQHTCCPNPSFGQVRLCLRSHDNASALTSSQPITELSKQIARALAPRKTRDYEEDSMEEGKVSDGDAGTYLASILIPAASVAAATPTASTPQRIDAEAEDGFDDMPISVNFKSVSGKFFSMVS